MAAETLPIFWPLLSNNKTLLVVIMKVRGYGTAHNANGDLSYFSWEGTSKVTSKEGGAVELTGGGQFNWLGGTARSPGDNPGFEER